MYSLIIYKIVLFVNLYFQFGDDKYQVEASPKVNSRSLANNVDSAEQINLPFVNELYQAKTTEANIFDDSHYIPLSQSSKIKLRKKKKSESEEDYEPRKKSVKKKHKKKGRRKFSKFSKTFSLDNSNQSESVERRKPFDIVVHIKVNELK